MTVPEIKDVMCEVTRSHDMFIVSERRCRPFTLQQLQAEDFCEHKIPTGSGRLFIARERIDLANEEIARTGLTAGGLIVLRLPIYDGPILFLASISVRTSWYDSQVGDVVSHDSSLPLYRPIISRIRKRLSRPMWAYGVQGGPARMYRDLGYSQGVVEWLRQGGDIRQEGVANVRFLIAPPSP